MTASKMSDYLVSRSFVFSIFLRNMSNNTTSQVYSTQLSLINDQNISYSGLRLHRKLKSLLFGKSCSGVVFWRRKLHMKTVYMEILSLFTGYLSDCPFPSFYRNLSGFIPVTIKGDVLPVLGPLDTCFGVEFHRRWREGSYPDVWVHLEPITPILSGLKL